MDYLYGMEVIVNPYLKKNEFYLVNVINQKPQIVRWVSIKYWKKSYARRNRKWEIFMKKEKEILKQI